MKERILFAPDNSSPPQRFPVLRAKDLPDRLAAREWLVEGLWLEQAVGIIGANPKSLKTWGALDLAVSVASATPCMGRFSVPAGGKVLVYNGEEQSAHLKGRLRALCESRNVEFGSLDVSIIDTPTMDLLKANDWQMLERTVHDEAPRLLILDPFVRLFGGHEDDASQVSRVLGRLRRLQRDRQVAIVLVHHFRKGPANGGQSLRGSSDFHAWTDSAWYMRRRKLGVEVVVEHRSAAAPSRFYIGLSSGLSPCLRVLEDVDAADEDDEAPRDLEAEVEALLRGAGRPLGRGEIRDGLRVRNETLGDVLNAMAVRGTIEEVARAWCLVDRSVPGEG